MSNRTPRNIQLLQQIGNNQFKNEVARAFDIAGDYEKDVLAVALDRRLSPEGKKDKVQGHLRQALRDLRDLRKPIEEFHAKTETMRAAVKMPTYDKADLVSAMARRELRDASRAMTSGQRAAKLSGPTRSAAFIDAILEFADDPWIAGIDAFNPNELQVFEAAKSERLRDLHAPLLDSIAARETVESEAMMIVNVVRGDIAADSGLELREFEEAAKPIESKQSAPWLRKYTEDGKEVIRVIDLENHGARVATPREVLDGKFYKDHAEYLADRAA
jgi:hypothetical protein